MRSVSHFHGATFGGSFFVNYILQREQEMIYPFWFKQKKRISACYLLSIENKKFNTTMIEGIAMNDFKRDLLIGSMFITGIFGFISGEFIISTVLFAASAIYSNIALVKQRLA